MMDFEKPIIWVFLPTPLTLGIIENINSELVVYYCIDNFRVSSPAASRIAESEITLIKKSDLVFVTSRELFKYCEQFNPKVSLFPFAVNYEYFEKVRTDAGINNEAFKDIPKPRIGYIGGIHKWIDIELIKTLALQLPKYSFILIGPVQTDITSLQNIPNIHMLGKKAHNEIPALIKEFDVCMIPYLITEYTKNVYPTKLNEYLALGKPVISTALPEILAYNQANESVVTVATNAQEFSDAIHALLTIQESEKPRFISRRIKSAQKNGWAQRIEDMSLLIEETMKNKTVIYPDWNKNFLKVLRQARHNFFKILLAGFILLFLLFYTPFIWFLADPLQITQPPEKADCIVVFAGGVGESGKAMQGYEERVKYAVELYKNGFADHLIFSSGYSFYFKEPFIMKALAVSLGVPEQNIRIDDKASNTYKNVLLTKEILEKNNWQKILLVSAPYHMKRCALILQKNAPAVTVVFTPVPHSNFYAHKQWSIRDPFSKQLNYMQFKSLIHEYLALVVYKYNGWI